MKKNKTAIIIAAVIAFVAIAVASGFGAYFLFGNVEGKDGAVKAVTEDFVEDTLLLERVGRSFES